MKQRLFFTDVALVITTIFIVAIFSICGTHQRKKQQEQANEGPEGWLMLFDGKTLDGWDITDFGPQGPVYVSGGSIILEVGDDLTGITWNRPFPAMDYEVELEAMKVSGNDFFCGMTFPVGDDFCSFIVGGWAGPVVGLSSIDGVDASENETSRLMKFEHDTWYKIRLKVSPGKIEAWINEDQVVDFVTEGRKLSIRSDVYLSKPFGIATWRTKAALRGIKVKKTA